MTEKTINTEILNYLHALSKAQRLNVLGYIKSLIASKKQKNQSLLALAGSISDDDAKLMQLAIQEGCESIDEHEW